MSEVILAAHDRRANRVSNAVISVEIVRKSLEIASEIDIYTNSNITVQELAHAS